MKGPMSVIEWMVRKPVQALETRHWSPQQPYATGDVLVSLLRRGWQVRHVQQIAERDRAPLYRFTLEREGETLCVRVLDGPVVRGIAAGLLDEAA